jgi:hypothetical protein
MGLAGHLSCAAAVARAPIGSRVHGEGGAMTGTRTFADIIRAVTDIWGLLALALLLIGLLAIQLT